MEEERRSNAVAAAAVGRGEMDGGALVLAADLVAAAVAGAVGSGTARKGGADAHSLGVHGCWRSRTVAACHPLLLDGPADPRARHETEDRAIGKHRGRHEHRAVASDYLCCRWKGEVHQNRRRSGRMNVERSCLDSARQNLGMCQKTTAAAVTVD